VHKVVPYRALLLSFQCGLDWTQLFPLSCGAAGLVAGRGGQLGDGRVLAHLLPRPQHGGLWPARGAKLGGVLATVSAVRVACMKARFAIQLGTRHDVQLRL